MQSKVNTSILCRYCLLVGCNDIKVVKLRWLKVNKIKIKSRKLSALCVEIKMIHVSQFSILHVHKIKHLNPFHCYICLITQIRMLSSYLCCVPHWYQHYKSAASDTQILRISPTKLNQAPISTKYCHEIWTPVPCDAFLFTEHYILDHVGCGGSYT